MGPGRFSGLLVGLFVVCCARLVQGEDLAWPLAIKAALTSTFGETRSASFHAGIDIKTWGKTGYEVRAVADGQIVRLKTSPWGYGRAIYHQLKDGRIIVYAHLEGFAARLAAPVEKAQNAKGFYSVNLFFDEEELPVEKGELIGWSGKSGAGFAHLHLEMRDVSHRPINPLMHGYAVEDSLAPTLQRLALIPFGSESMVDGGRDPLSVALRWHVQEKRFEAAEIPLVYGRIGVAILVYDRADGADNKLAPYYQTLSVDGESVFAAAYDRFAYGDQYQIALDRTRLSYPGGAGSFYNMFWAPGNRLTFYTVSRGRDGVLHCGRETGPIFLDKGLHLVEITAADIAGNRSLAQVQVRVNAPPFLSAAQLSREGDEWYAMGRIDDEDDAHAEVQLAHSRRGDKWKIAKTERLSTGSAFRFVLPTEARLWRLQVEDGAGGRVFQTWSTVLKKEAEKPQLTVRRRIFSTFAELVIESNLPLAEVPQVQLADAVRDYLLTPRQTALLQYRVDVPFESAGGEGLTVDIVARYGGGVEVGKALYMDQRPVFPKGGVQRVYDDGAVAVDFPENSPYELFFPQAEKWQPGPAGHLVDTGIAYALFPDGMSFDRKVAVQLRYSEAVSQPERLGIYEVSDNGKWLFVGNELDSQRRTVRAQIRRFARFALMGDVEPPVIAKLRPTSAAVVEIGRPLLSAMIKDEGSGIVREEDIVMELDGKRLISEYDPEEDLVRYLVEEELAVGAHELVVRVRDASGNEASARSVFAVRQRP